MFDTSVNTERCISEAFCEGCGTFIKCDKLGTHEAHGNGCHPSTYHVWPTTFHAVHIPAKEF